MVLNPGNIDSGLLNSAIPNLCLFTLGGHSRRAMPIARLKIQVPGWMFVFCCCWIHVASLV